MIKQGMIWIGMVFLLSTCTKDGKNITVQGRVLNPVTGEGIPNARIELLKETSGSPGNSGGYKEVEVVYSDANGSFELNHTSWFPRLVACYPNENIYENMGWAEDGVFLDKYYEKVNLGRFTNLDYWAVPYGALNGHFKSDNCEGTSDIMQFRVKLQLESDYGPWSSERAGCYELSTASPAEVPMGYRYYETRVIRPSGTTYVYDTVFVTQNGTSFVEILY